ncbi:LysR family transcriptional regulator [Halobacteriovorax sp. GB3]|uniref:LysR family transcriptional regulator n=1 Tax=Halobacteriovorax sp. GB3 TaxID=2719615 RepID=UPI002361C35C|nr:LysR family transcriptional regulator [Halobacteriovorax sp. GB3]MDD0852143.1 LysR family transcriptional regulator [Halobacteriovorax sp. GB3]
MNKDQFDGLIAFKVVSEERSFTSAAEKLQISPPAVSKMISQLEKKMGVTLFTRTTRTVSLSEAGRLFMEEVGPAIDQIMNAQNRAKSFSKVASGTLKINMPGVLFPYYLAKIIPGFLKKHPDVTVDLYSDDQASDIFDKGFDAGVRTGDIIAKDLTAFKLFGPVKFVTVASPEYLKEMGTPKHPRDLLEHNCIRHRFGSGNSVYEKWEFEDKKKEFAVTISGNTILNTSESIRHACLQGIGIAYTEFGNVEKDIKQGKLILILKNYHAQESGYFLYYPNRSQVSPTLRAFIDYIKEIRK